MAKPANTEAIEETTSIKWKDWVNYLNQAGAKDLEHREIADIAYEKLKGSLENAGWWSQSVAVAYEQHIGRRKPGQRSDGTYEFSVSKTFPLPMDAAMKAWTDFAKDKKQFNGVPISKEPATSETDKRRHWGCGMQDGSRLNVDVYAKDDKAVLYITLQKINYQTAVEPWKTYWKEILESL